MHQRIRLLPSLSSDRDERVHRSDKMLMYLAVPIGSLQKKLFTGTDNNRNNNPVVFLIIPFGSFILFIFSSAFLWNKKRKKKELRFNPWNVKEGSRPNDRFGDTLVKVCNMAYSRLQAQST